MKKFDLSTFNKDGNAFIKIQVHFDIVNGLVIETTEESVIVKQRQAPANHCDFICRAGSSLSSNFFEVSGFKEPSLLHFSANYNYTTKSFFYVLPENKEFAIQEIKEKTKKWIKETLIFQQDKMKQALDLINK